MLHHTDVKCLRICFVYCPSFHAILERTRVQYTAHLVFMERSLLNLTYFLSLPKTLEAFAGCVSSSVSSLLLLATVEPRYLNSFTLIEQFYLTHKWDPNSYYYSGSEWN